MTEPAESVWRYAFFNNAAHPMGRLLLERLCAAGFPPRAVVEEYSSFAERKTSAYLKCLTPVEMPDATAEIAERFDIPVFNVENINSRECVQVIQRHQITRVILGNTRIVTPVMLAEVPGGFVNVHPGLLPGVRGAFPQCWSILEDEPVGCSCHFLDEGVDTGPIISRTRVTVFDGDTLESVVARTMFAGADLLLDTMARLAGMDVTSTPQAPGEGKTFPWPAPEAIAAARERLALRQYRYLTPR